MYMVKGLAGGASDGGGLGGAAGVGRRSPRRRLWLKMACARQQTKGRQRGGGGVNQGGGDCSRRGKRPAACDNGKVDGKVSEGGIGAGGAGAPSNDKLIGQKQHPCAHTHMTSCRPSGCLMPCSMQAWLAPHTVDDQLLDATKVKAAQT